MQSITVHRSLFTVHLIIAVFSSRSDILAILLIDENIAEVFLPLTGGGLMLHYKIYKDEAGNEVVEIDTDGMELLHNPILNKGSAFTTEERKLFRIDGYLPPAISTLDMQLERRYEGFSDKDSDLEKYIYLRALQDRNETLFYALLLRHLGEMIPIVYTPTVGLACQMFSHIFRFTRGVFLSPENITHIDEIFHSLPYRNIEMIVATDSEGILGLGDQGVGGMGIPVGKLSLYTGGAGIHPANCLPVTLDVGTNNEELLKDPLYLGIKRNRIRGDEYLSFVDQFVQGVKRNFPNAVLQWEDFSKQNAFTLLDKYRDEVPSFNDDIQGTGAVVLAGVKGALRLSERNLTDQVFAILGAGAGGIGVARQIHRGLVANGLSPLDARKRIYVLDRRGVVHDGQEKVDEYKKEFSREKDFARGWTLEGTDQITLLDLARNAGITVLIGLSGVGGSFSESIVRAVAENTEKPVIFPLSNPTVFTEAAPEDIYRWTDGKAIVATGSPFPDVKVGNKTFTVGQGNNVFIFPGVGLGALSVGASTITDGMITAAAKRLSEIIPQDHLDINCVYPHPKELREVCKEIAVAVAGAAIERGVARKSADPDHLEELVQSRMWTPKYARYTRGPEGSEV
jgi:malate dehydrogenase (oxaloacetate-decarboxylating)/malate dehydrogenase (oxaloacetate-decarboxylating)(NADP+)